MKPPRILIVDDDDDVRRTLRGVMRHVCEVLDASNGLDGLRLLQRDKPRLVLLDLAMPEMGGLEVLAAALRVAPDVTVVMLSGDADVASAAAALNLGACAYVTKPFDPAALRDEIARLLQPRRRPGEPPWQVRAGS